MLIPSIPFRNLHLLVIFFSLGALVSCYHKDVLRDNADNVESALIYQGPEGNQIICLETVFQANSKSSGKGVTRVYGNNEYRLSSYELGTGWLSARVNLSEESDDDRAIVLGQTPGKIWLYSTDKRLGLHCRNPRTLAVIATQEQIAAASTLKTVLLATPNPSQLNAYFGFDWESGRPILTDKEGYTYLLNPQDYSIEKTNQKIEPTRRAIYFSTYGEWIGQDSAGSDLSSEGTNVYRAMRLSGDTRKTLQAGDQSPGRDSLSYLFGNFIMDENPAKAADRMSRLLSDDSITCFVACADLISDSARLVITKIRQNEDLSCTELWKCRLDHFYFRPQMAEEKMSSFETVMSKGNPMYTFRWIDMAGGQLIIISQLKMTGIDTKTGKINWEISL